jgi:hypothetical protein
MILVKGRARPHGDLAGAEAKLKDANQGGPHWADPLKAWGDVLLKQGKTKDARRWGAFAICPRAGA